MHKSMEPTSTLLPRDYRFLKVVLKINFDFFYSSKFI